MGITGSIIVYVLIWWIIFFSVLPVGIQSKKNAKFREIFRKINNVNSEITNTSERSFLETIKANCNSPVSVYAKLENQQLNMQCQILSHNGELMFNESMNCTPEESESIGKELGHNAIQKLGQDTIDKLHKLENDFNYTPKR
mgnify:CR=1 FL=1